MAPPRLLRSVADGALHDGHAALAAAARKSCDHVVASIFVNPAQFAPHEDLDKYPRSLDADLAVLERAGADAVFVPPVSEMYPAGISLHVAQQQGTFVEVKGKSHQMEGSIRPHFFRGVATVVAKLLNIVQPTHAFFGQKDVQQCAVVRSMVRDLHFPTEVVVVPTIREPDGLAMSSRNRYLAPNERLAAPVLYRALLAAESAFAAGVHDRNALLAAARSVIDKEPAAAFEYVSIADPFSLQEVDAVDPAVGAILSGAVRIGSTRIIDNILLGMPASRL